jgi:hypothetical protein
MQRSFWFVILCFSFWQVVALAQSSDHEQNLSACKSGSVSCDHAQLTQSEASAIAAAEHQRNFSDCMNVFGSCDYSRLTGPEANAVAIAEHDHNLSDCTGGLGTCDHSKLTLLEEKVWPQLSTTAIYRIAPMAPEAATDPSSAITKRMQQPSLSTSATFPIVPTVLEPATQQS